MEEEMGEVGDLPSCGRAGSGRHSRCKSDFIGQGRAGVGGSRRPLERRCGAGEHNPLGAKGGHLCQRAPAQRRTSNPSRLPFLDTNVAKDSKGATGALLERKGVTIRRYQSDHWHLESDVAQCVQAAGWGAATRIHAIGDGAPGSPCRKRPGTSVPEVASLPVIPRTQWGAVFGLPLKGARRRAAARGPPGSARAGTEGSIRLYPGLVTIAPQPPERGGAGARRSAFGAAGNRRG